ncbi:tRNA (adenosine(37)-N6)-threonylcarbamoyltransferase complex dimerization subunit type 1 TsaB [Candidatus Tachikawaea gelatinosa]|uniref:tRNA threonylcarbamoyladenosine biosynthesis protein TsaB n=1 Tax=Candidatus Tachikawaea gelatinosa TaxID=1410383 RepID=A0A090AJH2_9ENTR|nr:tRNA (adenosine(37)-N6)-threonylcarbamoyltransferase complex dimerization subunit type 1 TsaB [Candidatus Tachikawaea gelatinosa]BAP58593.1 peptidase M22 glycoprotease [Candidatus Tachikawaea gelatinosa]
MCFRILSFDTSTELCSVAILNKTKVYYRSVITNYDHNQFILPLINYVLKKSNLKLTELDAIAFSQGPGSFTGVRISAAVAQGLSIGSNVPVIGISALETMAESAKRILKAKKILAMIDAKMNQFYLSQYRYSNKLHSFNKKEQLITIHDLLNWLKTLTGTWVIVGNSWQKLIEIFKKNKKNNITFQQSDIKFPDAFDSLTIAKRKFKLGQFITLEKILPVYLNNNLLK